ncbi:putative phosphatidate phosphatase isoform X2 [Ornithodoros turicata]|uniref:putative phosphatidate phosphatase isoform X2 n=1 Tax=Ornithodoros turicata TaxID=34597 RepID=UPI00313A22F9
MSDNNVRRNAMALANNLAFVVAFHAVCIAIVGIPILIYFVAGTPFKRGFFCNDESLMYPFRESTITSAMLYSYGLLIPSCFFFVVEFLRVRTKVPETLRLSSRYLGRWPVPASVQVLYQVFGSFFFGACVSQLITDIAKYSIGRLRPHFFDLCKPSNLDLLCGNNRHAYIEDFTCGSGASPRLLKEVRLSFLSGHSSFSAYTMFFAVLYLQARVTWRGGAVRIGRAVVQTSLVCLAWYTALSRVSDYKHHWSDVLAGALQGYIVAILIVFGTSPLFNRQRAVKDIESPE